MSHSHPLSFLLAPGLPPPSFILTAILTTLLSAPLLYYAVIDYEEYLSLEAGGLPYNVWGWLIVTVLLRPWGLSGRAARDGSVFARNGAAGESEGKGSEEMKNLPRRKGERPVVRGIVPHRQMSQNGPESMHKRVNDLFQSAIKNHPDLLEWKTSLYERHNGALFIRPSAPQGALPKTAMVSRLEITHQHPDRSLHLYLSHSDAKIAVERGWAERHKLCGAAGGLFERWSHVGGTYLLVYGPRDEGELEVLRLLVRRGIGFMTGVEGVEF